MKEKFTKFFGVMTCLSLATYLVLLCISIFGNDVEKALNDSTQNIVFKISILFCFGYAILNIHTEYRKDVEDNKVLLKKRQAIDFCAMLKKGTRDEFISAYGEEMYEYLLRKGVIHELYEKIDNAFYWEFTKKGELVLNDLKKL